MPLRDLQTDFMHAILSKDQEKVSLHESLLDPSRLSIYTNNVFGSLTKTLQAIYPVIERLVGEEFFRYTAQHYIERYPSTSGDLNQYGAHFAEFLSDFPAVASLPYLPDAARLELCCHHSYLAADDTLLDMQRLAAVPQHVHGELRFRLSSSAHLLQSLWPIDSIWRVNQADFVGDQSVDLATGGVRLLVQRRRDKIVLMSLTETEWRFLNDIAAQNNLETIIENILDVEPDTDVAVLLQKFVAQSTLVDFTHQSKQS